MMPAVYINTPPLSSPGLQDALAFARRLYPREYARRPEDGRPSVMETHALIPEALRHAFATFGVLMAPELRLSRAQHEMIATVVSAANRCHY